MIDNNANDKNSSSKNDKNSSKNKNSGVRAPGLKIPFRV